MTIPSVYYRLIKLAQDIALRRPPFDSWYWPTGVGCFASKYHMYKEIMPDVLRLRFENDIKYGIEFDFLFMFDSKNAKPNLQMEPDFFNEYQQWEDTHLGTRCCSKDLYMFKEYPRAQIISNIFKANFPGIRKTKEHPISGGPVYKFDRFERNIFIGWDIGRGPGFSLSIGFEEPYMMFDVGSFFGGGQSDFSAVSTEEVVWLEDNNRFRSHIVTDNGPEAFAKSTNEAVNLVDIILPYIISAIYS